MGGGQRRGLAGAERGVSDVYAFSLTFAIIIVGVGLVSLVALDPIATFSDNQQVVNSERGLQAAGSTVDDIHRGGDVYKQFDLVPGGGALFVNETSIELEANGLGEELPEFDGDTIDVQTKALEHQFEDRSLGYEAGGVFRTDAAGLSYRPSIRCGERATVSLVRLTTTDDIRTGTVFDPDIVIDPTRVPAETPATAANEFAAFEVRRDGVQQATIADNITIDVSGTASPENWNQHLEGTGWEDNGDGEWECDVARVSVRITTVELGQLE